MRCDDSDEEVRVQGPGVDESRTADSSRGQRPDRELRRVNQTVEVQPKVSVSLSHGQAAQAVWERESELSPDDRLTQRRLSL